MACPSSWHHLLKPVRYDKDLARRRIRVGRSQVHAAPITRDLEILDSRDVEQRNRILPGTASRSCSARHHHAPALAIVTVEEKQRVPAGRPPRQDSAVA